MTHPKDEMPDNPGSPDATDEANYSPDEAEAAAAEAAAADGLGEEDADGHVGQASESSADEPVSDPIDDELADLLSDAEVEANASDAPEAETEAAIDATDDITAEGDAVDAAGSHAVYEEKIAELTDDLKRVGAEFANYRRRTERERNAAVTNAKARVLGEVLPVLDDLDLARQHGHLDEGPFKAFADKLHNILDTLGLKRFGEPGDEFNPDIHEAIQDNSTGDDKALETVLRPGYRYDTAVVRNAMVIIGNPAEGTSAPDGN